MEHSTGIIINSVKKKSNLLLASLAFISLALFGLQDRGYAQATGITRTELQRKDLSIHGHEAVQVTVAFEKGAAFGKHSHPGEEIIYVLEGSIVYEVEDQLPVTLKAGEVLFIPAGKAHSAINAGDVKAVELATYIVEKGKPIVNLIPEKKGAK